MYLDMDMQGSFCICAQPMKDFVSHWLGAYTKLYLDIVRMVSIDSGNRLVPSGNKPLPDPVLAYISHAICCQNWNISFLINFKSIFIYEIIKIIR